MDRPSLTNEQEYPDDDVLARYLGEVKPAWDAFAAHVAADVRDAALEWRYYRDGNSWLGKVVRKKKTVCWVSIWDRLFKTTFYFTAKNDEDVEGLPLAMALKDAYRSSTFVGKVKPLTIEVKSSGDLEDLFTLVGYKIGTR